MKSPWSLFNRLLSAALVGFVTVSSKSEAGITPPVSLRVMTYNLRYASDQPPNAWTTRRPIMVESIRASAPDIMGTQEGVYRQIRDLTSDLLSYDWIGQGRQGGSKDEYCAIFYRRDHFTPLAYDHFWLSDTPDRVGSMTWGNRWVRMATWVHFRDERTQREFIVLNTHWDHQVAEAREKSAALIRDRIAQFDPNIPLIVLGDFNCPAGLGVPFTTLTSDTGLVDTWSVATSRSPEPVPNTCNGFKSPIYEGERIDWILARNFRSVSAARIVLPSDNASYPSDHFPVVAELDLD